MFAEPSPAGAKYAASLLGFCSEECRLPVMPLSEATRERIRNAMQQLNLL
jgi:4-hydroxy-tetrahydrodipicolinate synthase